MSGELHRSTSHRLRYGLEVGLKLEAHGTEELIQVPRQLPVERRRNVVRAVRAENLHC
jgi:hypothetical protein